MVPRALVVAWEDAYRRYGGAAGPNIISTSRAVASAWLGLAECEELPWWLSAALRSAVEAFERQAAAWQTCADREAADSPPPRQLVRGNLWPPSDSDEPYVPQVRRPEDDLAPRAPADAR